MVQAGRLSLSSSEEEVEPDPIFSRLRRRPKPDDIENRLRRKRVYATRAFEGIVESEEENKVADHKV